MIRFFKDLWNGVLFWEIWMHTLVNTSEGIQYYLAAVCDMLMKIDEVFTKVMEFIDDCCNCILPPVQYALRKIEKWLCNYARPHQLTIIAILVVQNYVQSFMVVFCRKHWGFNNWFKNPTDRNHNEFQKLFKRRTGHTCWGQSTSNVYDRLAPLELWPRQGRSAFLLWFFDFEGRTSTCHLPHGCHCKGFGASAWHDARQQAGCIDCTVSCVGWHAFGALFTSAYLLGCMFDWMFDGCHYCMYFQSPTFCQCQFP